MIDKVPYLRGQPMTFPDWHTGSDDFEWRENVPFSADLEFGSFRRGRSAVGAIFHDPVTDVNYYMFLSEVELLIINGIFQTGGIVSGTFDFVKRGSNYGIRLLEDRTA